MNRWLIREFDPLKAKGERAKAIPLPPTSKSALIGAAEMAPGLSTRLRA
jgi:hypothetical protein